VIDLMALLGTMTTVIKASSGHTQDILIYLYMSIVTFLILKPSLLDKLRTKKEKRCYNKTQLSEIVADKVLDCIRIREEYDFKIDQVRHSVMRDQMSMAENGLERMKHDIFKNFSKALKETTEDMNEDAWSTSRQFSANLQIYEKLLDTVFIEILAEARRAFRDNGLDKMSDAELELYSGDIGKTCHARVDIMMMQQYNESVMILKYEEKPHISEEDVLKHTKEIFRHARKISINAYAKIKELEEQFNEELVREMKLTEFK